MITTTLEFARSINKATKDAVTAASVKNIPAGSLIRKDWYDPIWRADWRTAGIQPRRAKLVADEALFEETVDANEATLQLPSPAPEFASRYSFVNNHARWMNVVKFADYSSRTSKFALTFPPNVKGDEFPRLDITGSSLCTREGVVLFCQYKSRQAALRLLSQRDAVIGWLKSRGIGAEPSSQDEMQSRSCAL
jgi:hypothetical protein